MRSEARGEDNRDMQEMEKLYLAEIERLKAHIRELEQLEQEVIKLRQHMQTYTINSYYTP
jgi:hypothetical protein